VARQCYTRSINKYDLFSSLSKFRLVYSIILARIVGQTTLSPRFSFHFISFIFISFHFTLNAGLRKAADVVAPS